MFGRDIARYRRITAALLCVLVVLVVVASSACIVCRAHHDCCGEGCAICGFIQRCEDILRTLTAGAFVYAAVPAILFLVAILAGAAVSAFSAATLIEQNIRLND